MARHRLPVVNKLERYRGQPGVDFAIDALEECSITGKSPFKAGAAARGLSPLRGQPGIDYAMQVLEDCGSTAYCSTPAYGSGEGGISGWWLVPALIAGGVIGVMVGSAFGLGIGAVAMCDMSPDELKKFLASCPPGLGGRPVVVPSGTPAPVQQAPQS